MFVWRDFNKQAGKFGSTLYGEKKLGLAQKGGLLEQADSLMNQGKRLPVE